MNKKVVVIGGGFAGSEVAKKLERKFDVTLIDTKDYFEFTPGILRTIVEPEHIKKIQVKHSDYLKKAKILIGRVREVGKDFVRFDGKKIKFDYLVIASGSSYNAPFKEQKVVTATRAKHLRSFYNELFGAEKILIIGGGLVGVELAGEILWKHRGKKITIVHSADKLIQRNNDKSVRFATKFLEKKGVEIFYNERVVGHKKDKYLTDKKREIEADMAFLCTGIKPNYDFMKKNFSRVLNSENQIKVNEFLQVDGEKNIFAVGDVNDRAVEKTAQNAERQGRLIVHNICALDSGKELEKYWEKKTPLVISLGKNCGIFTSSWLTFCGWIPGVLKRIVEKKEMAKKWRLI